MRATRSISQYARALLFVAYMSTTMAARGDRRIVDRIVIGDARSEAEHAYAGSDVTVGTDAGRTFRQARGWMRYALTVFDDTEVTVACTFLGSDSAQTFDLMVENQLVTTYTFRSQQPDTVEFRLPIALTKGRTNILVLLRAANGPTPSLVELRTVQDHNE